MAFVYWIHTKNQKDIFSEGYVGVTTTTPEQRYKKHKSDAKGGSKLSVHNAIKKYGEELLLDTVVEASEDYCYEVEEKLRPSRRIGWNIVQGGGKSPLSGIPKEEHPCFGKPCSKETRAKISAANSGDKNGMSKCVGELNHFFGKSHSEETIAKLKAKVIGEKHREINRARLKALSSWETSNAIKANWMKAFYFYEMYTKGVSLHQVAKEQDILPSQIFSMFKKFKNNWNPHEDMKYTEWFLSQKELNNVS